MLDGLESNVYTLCCGIHFRVDFKLLRIGLVFLEGDFAVENIHFVQLKIELVSDKVLSVCVLLLHGRRRILEALHGCEVHWDIGAKTCERNLVIASRAYALGPYIEKPLLISMLDFPCRLDGAFFGQSRSRSRVPRSEASKTLSTGFRSCRFNAHGKFMAAQR